MITRKPITVIQGGQWGSEAKGAVAAAICINRNIDIAVRTGAINAGHTVVYKDLAYAMQQIPTGWVNPRTQLVIGAGAYIHPPTLFREIEMINAAMPEADVLDRLFIDFRCGVHTEEAEDLSKAANRHHSIGATGKGCSEAIVAKIRGRNAGYKLFREWLTAYPQENAALSLRFIDTVKMLNTSHDMGLRILIEGTQGTALDLHTGPYPYTTSRMTSAANWVAESGLSPALNYEVVLVCRTYPIRVAGNSGPMPGEIEWTELANSINMKLINAGKPSLISGIAIETFRSKLEYAASEAVLDGRYKVPVIGNSFNTRLASWTANERSLYRVAASELHRDAFKLCGDYTVSELRKLFEMTTVTKKLRRIAALDMDELRTAVMMNRPAWIAMTFMDYQEPELANLTSATIDPTATYVDRAAAYVEQIQSSLGVPVKYISTGPKHDNFISTVHLTAKPSQR